MVAPASIRPTVPEALARRESVKEKRAPRTRFGAAHLAAKHVDELGQVLDLRVLEKPPDSRRMTEAVAIGGAAEPERDVWPPRRNALSADEDRSLAVTFDRECHQDHQGNDEHQERDRGNAIGHSLGRISC